MAIHRKGRLHSSNAQANQSGADWSNCVRMLSKGFRKSQGGKKSEVKTQITEASTAYFSSIKAKPLIA